MTDACWHGKYTMNDNKFHEFLGLTQTGEDQYVFDVGPFGSDMPPMVRGRNNEFINVDDKAFGYFYDPKPKWANVKDCGEFPCSAPFNVLMQMKQTKFTGIQPTFGDGVDVDNFQLIADNPGFAPFVPNCERRVENNMYICQQEDLGMLVWESLDSDNRDRGMQPIYVGMEGTEMSNKINSFMDHVWDGFYSGQVRESRFFSIVYPPKGSVYNMTFAGGSPAKKMKFEMRSDSNNVGMTIRIAYPSAEARKIIKNGEDIAMNEWNEKERGYGPVTQSFCGENRYIGVVNILEFYITKDCQLEIAPRNAIQTMVRMEWTVDAFFDNGGTTQFIDRVAGSLGIHASTVKIVSVYEGSLVVNYGIENDNEEELAQAKAAQTQAFATGGVDLGAPITDVEQKVTNDKTMKPPAVIQEDSDPIAMQEAFVAAEEIATAAAEVA